MSIFNKKIISASLLILFLVSFILPFSNALAAGDLVIAADPVNISLADAQKNGVKITATTHGLANDWSTANDNKYLISFKFSTAGLSYPLSCNLPFGSSESSCSNYFFPTKQGIYTVEATFQNNNESVITPVKSSNALSINVGNVSFLTATAEKKTIDINEATKITVTTSDTQNNIVIKFSSTGSSLNYLDKTTCTTDASGSCSVIFKSPTEGDFGLGCSSSSNPSYTTCSIGLTVRKGTASTAKTEGNYYPLAPLPGIGETCTTKDTTGKTICVKTASDCVTDPVTKKVTCTPGTGFATYLNAMIEVVIGLCAVLAMIMIIMGGIQYMTSELVSGKQEGRKKITQAILGLLLALGAFAILNTINPDLLNISLNSLPTATVTMQDDAGPTPTTITTGEMPAEIKAVCTNKGGVARIPEVLNALEGKVTYRWGGYGQNPPFVTPWVQSSSPNPNYTTTENNSCPTGTVCLDCLGFTYFVLDCVGIKVYPSPGMIFNQPSYGGSLEKITEKLTKNGDGEAVAVINGKNVVLQPGDIIGSPGKASGAGHTHGYLYYGKGMAMECYGTEGWASGVCTRRFDVVNGEYNTAGLITGIRRIGTTPGTTQATTKTEISKITYAEKTQYGYTVRFLHFNINNNKPGKIYYFKITTAVGDELVSKKKMLYDLPLHQGFYQAINDTEYTNVGGLYIDAGKNKKTVRAWLYDSNSDTAISISPSIIVTK